MNHFKNDIYEKLLADNRFINWASGKDKFDSEYWEDWKKRHPEFQLEFEDAIKTVQLLQFQSPDISNREIEYIWDKTDKRLNTLRRPLSSKIFLSWMSRVAAILVIPLIISVIWLYQNNLSIKNNFAELTNQLPQKTVTVSTPLGGLVNLQLPDGSKVWLDAGSEITYPAYFNSDKREVTLTGQAYFEIKKRNVPFYVKNAGPLIKVYGTAFSVSAYDNEENVIVALAEGKVSLDVNNKEIFMKPGEISKFNKQAHSFEILESDISQYVNWKDGVLIFRDATLATIARTLERHYNVSISIDDDDIANYKYNAILRGGGLEQMLDLLTLSAPIKYNYVKPKQKEDFSYTQACVIITKDTKRIVNQ
ncbi:FecR family protein [Maribellus maritimus]|uniref:FecR family protein n=1 Tax=Maribellus maritimus TaxID=2870838 RepID=UPI001EEC364F|nr:FecR domain-containing protein [Maribellus maritimus]MCG6187644.1 DUF4974 domain-containing protein [Maribellus maritimus]